MPSGNLEVLLERQGGDYKSSKLHRQLIELPPGEASDALEAALRKVSTSG